MSRLLFYLALMLLSIVISNHFFLEQPTRNELVEFCLATGCVSEGWLDD